MPVQINEVIIRTVVDTQPSASGSQGGDVPVADTMCSEEEILERILEIIQESKER
jgi:hypothetical protein